MSEMAMFQQLPCMVYAGASIIAEGFGTSFMSIRLSAICRFIATALLVLGLGLLTFAQAGRKHGSLLTGRIVSVRAPHLENREMRGTPSWSDATVSS